MSFLDTTNTSAFDGVEPGDYTATISLAEMKSWNDANYLNLEYTIVGPKNVGRKHWDKFYLFDTNEANKEKAMKKLKRLLIALPGKKESFTNQSEFLSHLKNRNIVIKLRSFTNDQGKELLFAGGYAEVETPLASAGKEQVTLDNMHKFTVDDIPF